MPVLKDDPELEAGPGPAVDAEITSIPSINSKTLNKK
jgi:hypothetical protein